MQKDKHFGYADPKHFIIRINCSDGVSLYFDKNKLFNHSEVLNNIPVKEYVDDYPTIEIPFDAETVGVYLYILGHNELANKSMVKSYRKLVQLLDYLGDFNSHAIDSIWLGDGGIIDLEDYSQWYLELHKLKDKYQVDHRKFYLDIPQYMEYMDIP